MSQEQPPLRSRRELRQARDERAESRQDTVPSAPGQVPPASKVPENGAPAPASKVPGNGAPAPAREDGTGRIRRVAPGPVDSVRTPSGSERSSQSRARDRAALRTIKELAQKEERLSGGGPPTRRQLRLQQLQAEAAPATAANLIVPPARTSAQRTVPQAGPGQPAPQAGPGQPVPRPKSQQAEVPATEAAAANPDSKLPGGMTVEQALAARSLIAEQARNQIAKMEHIAANDPEAVDPEILAEQIALAERAAILNKRAMAKQKLAEQANQPAHPKTEPSAVSNLAMVTPLEFEKVPGIDRPVMKKPATSYVPVVTNPGPRLQPAGTKGARKPGPARRTQRPATGRAGVLARAEAAAQAAADPAAATVQASGEPWAADAGENFVDRPRVAANTAYGLEPLDAVTAGLGRAHRIRLLQLAVLALGIVALIAGVTMIISGLAP
ncbi:hypothetical protein TV39_12340 [Arthrobacter sp. SPG23]|uniref:hypothetical protein n=1 Tax=Arthrobacter sp. SPG23 TaxID=1610703 RepID=UPI0005BBCFCD|nr:hypothetical protein [Arthrobacter sp. SPG23]KIS27289.1 hypothetical protein TV39_12340 [Arthrobacter sp. SPG23]